LSFFGFTDVDGAGSAREAAAYLEAAAEQFRARRLASLDVLDLGDGSTILDAGCGLGELVREIAARVGPGGSAIGVDLSEELIDRARSAADAEGSATRFEVGDVTRLRFPDETFDAVRCERVFQHLDDKRADAAASEFVRVAKPGGRIYLTDAIHTMHSVDCDDRDAFEAVLAQLFKRIRDPYAGIRLARRLQIAGATIRSFEVISTSLSYDNWTRAVALDELVDAVVGTGDMSRARADAFRDDLVKRDAAGMFYAAAGGARVLAVKQDTRDDPQPKPAPDLPD